MSVIDDLLTLLSSVQCQLISIDEGFQKEIQDSLEIRISRTAVTVSCRRTEVFLHQF